MSRPTSDSSTIPILGAGNKQTSARLRLPLRRCKILALLAIAAGSSLWLLIWLIRSRAGPSFTPSQLVASSPGAGRNHSSELAASSGPIFRPARRFSERQLQAELDRLRASSSTYNQNYPLEPRDNSIDCPHQQEFPQEGGETTTLHIVINSRADNFERRRRLRSSWLRRETLKHALCGAASAGGRLAAGWLTTTTTTTTTSQGVRDRMRSVESSADQINHTPLAHKARVARIEWTFTLGQLDQLDRDSATKQRLEEESRLHGDLLVLNVRESYRAMTLKHLAIFEWLLFRVAGAEQRGRNQQRQQQRRHRHRHRRPSLEGLDRKLVIKCDDDAQLELSQVMAKYVIETTGTPTRGAGSNLLMCARFDENSPVLRSRQDESNRTRTGRLKWLVSRAEWPYDTFPSYCSGLAYLASLELVGRLYAAASRLSSPLEPSGQQQRPLWIDDVYVTGVLLAHLDLHEQPLKLVKLNAYFCYTRAQRLHRESLEPGLKCMAAELEDQQ